MNRRYLTFLLPLFFFCQNNPPASPPPSVGRTVLRVVDINVWSGLDYHGKLWMGEYETKLERENRYRALVQQLRALDPDVIGIQEANKLPGYAKRLAGDLGYDVFYHVGVGGVRFGPVGFPWNLREGDAILTKKDLHAQFAGRKQLSGGPVGNFFTFHFSDATQVLAVKLMNLGQPVYVFVTHWHAALHPTPEVLRRAKELKQAGKVTAKQVDEALQAASAGTAWRKREAQKTIDFIRAVAGRHPFILMGDFNALPDSPEIRLLLNSGMVDAFRTVHHDLPGYTWDPSTNLNHQKYYLKRKTTAQKVDLLAELDFVHTATPKRIDYIFTGPVAELDSLHIGVKDCRVVLDQVIGGIHASDHYGVLADIVFGR